MKPLRMLLLGAALATAPSGRAAGDDLRQQTFCNPLDLDYCFSVEGSYREAADPMVVVYNDDYYLFASKSGGYWWSHDFRHWTLVRPTVFPVDLYAPGAFVLNGELYCTFSTGGAIYKTSDPKGGQWEKVCDAPFYWNDPWLFVDDDQRVYAVWGSSEAGTIGGAQLDPDNGFAVVGSTKDLILTNTEENGFEVAGDNNESGAPWTEGAQMVKHDGKYYVVYATPNTAARSYCDAYYVSTSPLGPYTLGENSPMTRKSAGYVTGTGHGGLFEDLNGQWWEICSVYISCKAYFERRLAVFPVTFDSEGRIYCNTVMGDYPQLLPGQTAADTHFYDGRMDWNLLSYGRPATASTTATGTDVSNALDENMRTYWSATSGTGGEWYQVDLGSQRTVQAVQVNFWDAETTYSSGRDSSFATRYTIEASTDGSTWTTIIDHSASDNDTPHNYVVPDSPATARYLRVTNRGDIPGGGLFALSALRVFGEANGDAPGQASNVQYVRMGSDLRRAQIEWDEASGAEGYIVRYGTDPSMLWNHYQVIGDNSLDARALVTTQDYWFRIDPYNANGVTTGDSVRSLELSRVEMFPLTTFGGFESDVIGEGTFRESNKSYTATKEAMGGWTYGQGLDLSAYRYLVVTLSRQSIGTCQFRLYDEADDTSNPASYDFGDDLTLTIDLLTATRDDGTPLTTSSIRKAGFYFATRGMVYIDSVYVTNTATAVTAPPAATNGDSALHSLSGVRLPQDNASRPGLYIKNGKVVVMRGE